MLGNRLSLAIALVLYSQRVGVDKNLVQHHVERKPDVYREERPLTERPPAGGFREAVRRRNRELYRELLDAEREDRGLEPIHAQPEDQESP